VDRRGIMAQLPVRENRPPREPPSEEVG
jgi:hypothetical protein